MKKSFLPLLAGLIGIAGVTSANAWSEYKASTLRDSVKTYYRTSPLLADANGVALKYDSDAKSISFTDNFHTSYSYERHYVLGIYGNGGHNVATDDKGTNGVWRYCAGTSSCDDLSYHKLFRIIKTGSKGGVVTFDNSSANGLGARIQSAFDAGNDSVHVAVDSLTYIPDGETIATPMAPATGMFATSVRKSGSVGMYFIDFYRPPTDVYLWQSKYSSASGTETKIEKTEVNKQNLRLYPEEGAQYSYSRITYADAETAFEYRVTEYDGSVEKIGAWQLCASSSTQGYRNGGLNVFLGMGRSGGDKCSVKIGKNTVCVEVRAITKQVYSSAMGYEKTYVLDTAKRTMYIAHDYSIKSPYDLTNGVSGSGGSFTASTTYGHGGTYSTTDFSVTKSMLGDEISLKATPAAGYVFKGWYDEKNKKYVSTNSALDFVLSTDTTLTPHFEEVATDFSLKLTDRTGSSTDIYDNDGLQSDFVISKDGIKLNATATAAGDTKIRLYYCTESSLSDCTGNALKAIGSQFTFGSKNPDNYSKDIAVISNDGKITISGTSTAFSLPTNVRATFLWAELSRYRTSLTAVESVGKWVRLYWKYPVEFVKNDGTSPITTYNVNYGGSVTIPTANLGVPASTGTIRYDYYWQDMNSASTTYPKNTISISNITEAKKIKVVLSTEYLVKFVDFDGNPFTVKGTKASDAEQWVAAGQSATKPASNPDHKQNSDYQFNSWSGSYTTIGEPKTITATYKNKITYATPTNAAWKTEWKLNGETPTNYTAPEVAGSRFVGWEPSLANVSGPATYTAKYVKIPKIVFTVNGFMVGSPVEDLEVIAPNECFVETGREILAESNFTNEEIYGEIYYGISREGDCASNELVQEIDAATGYNAVGITPEITFTDIDKTVYSEAHNIEVSGKKVDGKIVSFCVTFNQTPAPAYLITFKDTDGTTTLKSGYVAEGQMPVAPTTYTIPKDDAQYKYSFGDWDPAIVAATKEQTYTAQLIKTTQVYSVRFLDADGNQIGESQSIAYGTTAEAPKDYPTKNGSVFLVWSKDYDAENAIVHEYDYKSIEQILNKERTLEITGKTDFKPIFVEIPEIKFEATGMVEGNDYIDVTSPSECMIISDETIAGVSSKNPMVAGKEYTWTATVSFDEKCVENDKLMTNFTAVGFANAVNNIDVKVPVLVNDVVANEDMLAALMGDFDEVVKLIYTFTVEAEEGLSSSSGNDDITSSSDTEITSSSDAEGVSSSDAAEEEGDNDSSSSAAEEGDKNSSSSTKKSSSSSAKDDAEESSSSSKKKSSSSSADEEDGDDDDDESSSSAKPNAIVTFDIPTFKATVSGRNLSIFGATVGAKTAIFDLQGSVISTGRVEAANFNVSLPRFGMYVVRIGNQIQKVNVR